MDAVEALQQRLATGEQVWHWLHDNPEWGEFTLLFISLHAEGDTVVAGLWEVYDEGTGTEDPVTFRPADPDGERGKPGYRLLFPDVASALAELAVHQVTAAGFHDHSSLVAKYGETVRLRPPQQPSWTGGAVILRDEADDR